MITIGVIIEPRGVIVNDWREAHIKRVQVVNVDKPRNKLIVAIESEAGFNSYETWNLVYVENSIKQGYYYINSGGQIEV